MKYILDAYCKPGFTGETARKYVVDAYCVSIYLGIGALEFPWTMSGGAILSGVGLTTTNLTIAGITKDNGGNALGSCDVFLLRDTGGSVFAFIAHTTSDPSTGAYSFTGLANGSASYMVIAWKDNTPHVFDATDYVLQPVGV